MDKNHLNQKYFAEPKYSKTNKILYEYKNKKYQIWYGKTGENKNPPILVLHGGPGGSHSNLTLLKELGFEREVIFYDQLGCGYSDKPNDTTLWEIDRYVDEVQQVVSKLNLRKFHLLGHSWGGMLATVFAYKYPKNILSLSLMSPILNMPRYIEITSKNLKSNLPNNYSRIIDDYELSGKGNLSNYQKALMTHLKTHICKFFPKPPEALTRLSHLNYPQVHDEMVGTNMTSELNVTGNIKSVDVSLLIKKIDIPILFTCGEVECCPPEDVEIYYKNSKKGTFYIFRNCHHMTMLENPEEFIRQVQNFVSKYD